MATRFKLIKWTIFVTPLHEDVIVDGLGKEKATRVTFIVLFSTITLMTLLLN